jgi:uncharacterized protein (DUF885 family)
MTRPVRELADAYVEALVELDPLAATYLGRRSDRMPDLSPAGQEARDALARETLTRLASVEPSDEDDRRCARLLRERLESGLAVSESGEHLRLVRNLIGPVQGVRGVFMAMPAETADDWADIARRMAAVPQSLAGYTDSLREGARRGLFAAPRQVETNIEQFREWGAGAGWFADFVAKAMVSPGLRGELDKAAALANQAVDDLQQWMAEEYLPLAEGTPDAVGEERYRLLARQWTGSDLDLRTTYEWGWAEFRRIEREMREQAERVLPGASVSEAMRHLDQHGEVVEGVEEIRLRLQQMIDQAMTDLDGTHFDLADPVKVLEARIAPVGSAAAPYYMAPAADFSRPGRTWLPTQGKTRFPLWTLVSTWYHEGVPGHHLQLAQWAYVSEQLSIYQTAVGKISAATEGWALYAERLMDELGYLTDPGSRLGYLEGQSMRAVRVIIDIGMHLKLALPDDAPLAPGETWTPELGTAFFLANSGRDEAFVTSEITRYLGMPGQAISYKLGERAWLAGRDAASAKPGFDLKSWHMAALSQGSLGLDDLTEELGRL